MGSRRESSVLPFFAIVGWTATLLGLFTKGYVSGQTTSIALLGLVVLAAIASKLRMSMARAALTVGLPCVGIATLVIRESAGDPQVMAVLAGSLAALFMALFGLYIIVRSWFG